MKKNLWSSARIHFVLIIVASTLFCDCKTGSNFETLKLNQLKVVIDSKNKLITGTLYVRPFTFTEVDNRSEMYRKAFLLPGYPGIDFDGYGRMNSLDEKNGMETIYSIPDIHLRVAEELTKLEINVTTGPVEPEKGRVALDIKILNSESSLRMHTYGCWPFVGTFVYLVNGNIYTIITHTRAEYTISDRQKGLHRGMLDVYSIKEFGFWSSYAGFEILESFDEVQQAHIKDFAAQLAAALSANLPL